MELTPLRYFVRAADRENFTKAAAELRVSQPALSRAVAGLEAELGRPLFEREGRRVRLTDAGRTFRDRAAKVIALADDAAAEVADDGATGTVRLAAIPTVAPFLLPSVLAAFAKDRPAATVRVTEDVTAECVRRLRTGETDLAVLALPVPDPTLAAEPLYDEPLLAALPPTHRLAGAGRVSADELRAEPFVLLGEAHCLSATVESFCRRSGAAPLAVERTSQLATVTALVAAGHGVSLVPAAAATDPRVAYRPLTPPAPSRTVACAWNPDRYASKLTRALLAVLRAAEPPGGPPVTPDSARPARGPTV